jgi:hypothetical protein
MLSERAKGKQRETEPQIPLTTTPRELVVRFTEGEPDLDLLVQERDTVRDVRRRVCVNLSAH